MDQTNQTSLLFSASPDKVYAADPRLEKECRITLIGDYHCTLDDERGKPYVQYSARMAQYGNADFSGLEKMFETAHGDGSDCILLLGDIISFPTEKGIEELSSLMKNSTLPVYFISGNHDWHYEGVPGSDMAQRDEWIVKRLKCLYGGADPMNYAVEVNGVKILLIDNSVYQIKPSQLAFLRKELSDGRPALIACHIPFYLPLPGHIVTSYGCGHPQWGAASDPYWEIERRERWAESGLGQTSFDFCNEIFNAPNVLGITAGHSHHWRTETYKGKFQIVTSSKHSTLLCLGKNFPA